jgi:hypothetical protein
LDSARAWTASNSTCRHTLCVDRAYASEDLPHLEGAAARATYYTSHWATSRETRGDYNRR